MTMRKTHMALLLGLAVVASAGLAGAAYAGQSIWGDANPGMGADHAAMPEAGEMHNQAGAAHPPEFAGQPDDVPPEGAGQPDDVPPADAGAPDELPEEADDHAREHYPPAALAA
ncbi:MAG TPA: hypothetical protein VGB42_12730 [Candidatus Thermoplasmatota archaeon]